MSEIERCNSQIRALAEVMHGSNRNVVLATRALKAQLRTPAMLAAAAGGGFLLVWAWRGRRRRQHPPAPAAQQRSGASGNAQAMPPPEPPPPAWHGIVMAMLPALLIRVVLPYLPEPVRPFAQHPAVMALFRRR